MSRGSSPLQLSPARVVALEQEPVHAVIVEVSEAARDLKCLTTGGFKKVLTFLLEEGNGRDRREPWTTKPGDAQPVPTLRVLIDECFGKYADYRWFRINKIANMSGQPLLGLFPRMGMMAGRAAVPEWAAVVNALLSPDPDAALRRLLQKRGGRLPGFGVDLFSRLAFALRRDLFFTLPRPWSETSGCLAHIDGDLRRYCELCRTLRTVCDDLNVPSRVRGSLLDRALNEPIPPLELIEAIEDAIGPTAALCAGLEPGDAYETGADNDLLMAMPVEFACGAIRARRGDGTLRQTLLREFGDRCALTGGCVRDLLEVAYLVRHPRGDGPTPDQAVLMRSDVHTLWDLNLIGIEPTTRRVFVASRLDGTVYEALAGRTLLARLDGSSVADAALRDRWDVFTRANPAAPPEEEGAAHRKSARFRDEDRAAEPCPSDDPHRPARAPAAVRSA